LREKFLQTYKNMSLKLTARLDQRMVLTPQLRQRIEMLQMTTLELSDLIQQEMLENPILEEIQNEDEVREISENILDQNSSGFEDYENSEYSASDREDRAEMSSDKSGEDSFDNYDNEFSGEKSYDENSQNETESYGESEEFSSEEVDVFEEIDFGREFQDYLDPGYKTQEFEFKEDAPSFEQFLSASESLSNHLEFQLNLCQVAENISEIAYYIVGNLDADGRLRITNEEIATEFDCSDEVVEKARQLVLGLDPVGCGSRSVQEALIAQLITEGNGDRIAVKIIAEHFSDLQPHRLQHLSKATNYSLEELNEELQFIRTLDPFPGRAYSTEAPIFVAPEVYIEKIDDDYVIYFVDDGSPRLRISHSYQQMLGQNGTSKETKDFIKDKVRSAVDLLRNIEHRRQTIYRVLECIILKQRDFLDKGVQFIKPMMLKDVAEDIGMHLSTISRVVNRKYAHTPQGVIEIRKFFSEGMLNEDGEEVSTRIIKIRIKKMIEDEDTRKTITDDDIAKVLSREGIKLSRRTVAKYRDQMQIPGSRERKTVV
jgi:RNA polymerase sigma-54 factor